MSIAERANIAIPLCPLSVLAVHIRSQSAPSCVASWPRNPSARSATIAVVAAAFCGVNPATYATPDGPSSVRTSTSTLITRSATRTAERIG